MGQQLVFKSKNALTDLTGLPDFISYKSRVEADGGVIYDTQATLEAFIFIYKNNISDGNILSATSASWGVKFDAATKVITKLYNLFSEAGDIVMQGSSLKAVLSTEIDNKPALYAGGSSTLFGVSLGVFNNIKNLTLHTIHHIPVLDNYGAGAGTTFPITHILDKAGFDVSTDSGKLTSLFSSAYQYMTRDTITQNDPNLWKEAHRSFRGSVGVNGNLYSSKVGYASIVKDVGFDIYKDGSVSNYSNETSTGDTKQRNNQKIYFLTQFQPNGLQQSYYYVGYIFENWVLNNSTADIAKALSIRAKTKYRS